MPKGRVLTLEERDTITRMHDGGASAREIAKKLERSKTVVLNYLKNPAQYAQIKRSGRKRALSRDDERRLYAALFLSRVPAPAPLASASPGAVAMAPADGAVLPGIAGELVGVASADGGVAGVGVALPPAPAPPAYQYRHQDVKMSAEQIKKEFNVPLSTRRIQQLLSEWRREARRAQDRQQQEPALAAEAVAAAAAPLLAVAVDASMAPVAIAPADADAAAPAEAKGDVLMTEAPPALPVDAMDAAPEPADVKDVVAPVEMKAAPVEAAVAVPTPEAVVVPTTEAVVVPTTEAVAVPTTDVVAVPTSEAVAAAVAPDAAAALKHEKKEPASAVAAALSRFMAEDESVASALEVADIEV